MHHAVMSVTQNTLLSLTLLLHWVYLVWPPYSFWRRNLVTMVRTGLLGIKAYSHLLSVAQARCFCKRRACLTALLHQEWRITKSLAMQRQPEVITCPSRSQLTVQRGHSCPYLTGNWEEELNVWFLWKQIIYIAPVHPSLF